MYIQQGLATAGDLETGWFFERVIKMNVKQKLLCYEIFQRKHPDAHTDIQKNIRILPF